MDATSWAARMFSASKRYQSALQNRSRDEMKWDAFDVEASMGFEDIEMDDEPQDEYTCPFCSEYFDIVGLCCHIDDEHPVEATNGVCPVCAMKVGVDMVAHITLQHDNIVKIQRKRKLRKAGGNSSITYFKREMREANFRSLFGASSRTVSSTPDPLLSSFILPVVEECEVTQSSSAVEPAKKSIADSTSERHTNKPPMSMKDKEEKAKRCNFVKELVLSAILDDEL